MHCDDIFGKRHPEIKKSAGSATIPYSRFPFVFHSFIWYDASQASKYSFPFAKLSGKKVFGKHTGTFD